MKEKKPITLKQRLLITALLIAVIPTIIVGGAAQVLARRTLEKEITKKN
jgi:hypothetical protein